VANPIMRQFYSGVGGAGAGARSGGDSDFDYGDDEL